MREKWSVASLTNLSLILTTETLPSEKNEIILTEIHPVLQSLLVNELLMY